MLIGSLLIVPPNVVPHQLLLPLLAVSRVWSTASGQPHRLPAVVGWASCWAQSSFSPIHPPSPGPCYTRAMLHSGHAAPSTPRGRIDQRYSFPKFIVATKYTHISEPAKSARVALLPPGTRKPCFISPQWTCTGYELSVLSQTLVHIIQKWGYIRNSHWFPISLYKIDTQTEIRLGHTFMTVALPILAKSGSGERKRSIENKLLLLLLTYFPSCCPNYFEKFLRHFSHCIQKI